MKRVLVVEDEPAIRALISAEVLRRLRADTATAAIPIVLLTGREPPEDAAADAVLLKPFTPATLRRSLAGWLT